MKNNCFNSAVLLFFFSIIGSAALGQAVGINSTGAAPNASAGLDVSFTNKGLLTPRLTAAQRAAIAAPATGLLVYQTDAGTQGAGFYFYNGTAWTPLSTQSGAWGLSGNTGTAVATNFLGTTDNTALAIKTNNTERLRVLNNGPVVVGGTSVVTGEAFTANGTYAVNGYSTAANGSGTWGSSTNATGFGLWGVNSNSTGTGIMGTGNNQTTSALVAGQGGAFVGTITGVYARSTTAATGQAGYFDQFGNIVRANYWSGTTQFKINGVGTVSTVVEDPAGEWRTMYCAESPDYYFTDYGQGQLQNGRTHIELDPILTKNVIVDAKHPMRVFVQLEGECKGVYVTNKTPTGFDVVELNGGTSNTTFQWNLVCNVADQKLPNGRVSKFADVRFQKVAPNLETREMPMRESASAK